MITEHCICTQCGVQFTAAPKGPRPLFCSTRCRVAAHRDRERDNAAELAETQARYTIPCPCCRKPTYLGDLQAPETRTVERLRRRLTRFRRDQRQR